MALAAVVKRESPISMEEWVNLAQLSPALAVPPAREVLNPFTRSTETSEPSPGEYNIVHGEAVLGAISPGSNFEDDGELDVWLPEGDREAKVVTTLDWIASNLSAEVLWLDDLDPSDE